MYILISHIRGRRRVATAYRMFRSFSPERFSGSVLVSQAVGQDFDRPKKRA
jgi:hypothetical protein